MRRRSLNGAQAFGSRFAGYTYTGHICGRRLERNALSVPISDAAFLLGVEVEVLGIFVVVLPFFKFVVEVVEFLSGPFSILPRIVQLCFHMSDALVDIATHESLQWRDLRGTHMLRWVGYCNNPVY